MMLSLAVGTPAASSRRCPCAPGSFVVSSLATGNTPYPQEDQMNYLMFVCVDAAVKLSPEERATIGPDVEAGSGRWMNAACVCRVTSSLR
jgi:hypothetical protein